MAVTSPTARRPGRRALDRAIEIAPLALVIVAEAAWISVIGGLLQEFGLRAAVLGVPALAAFVVGGVLAARVLGSRLGDRWPPVALGLVVLGAIGGLVLSGEARDATSRGILPAIAAHPGGLVAGLAVLRGFAHARLPLAEDTLTHLLAIGIPILAVASLVGGLIGEPLRSHFLADALGASIAFVASAALALALARLDAVGVDGGFDWRRNPRWLVVTIAILVLAIVVAVPLATVAGLALAVIIPLALGPMLIIGLATGLDQVARRLLVAAMVLGLGGYILIRLFGGTAALPSVTGVGVGGAGPSPAEQLMTISLGGLILVAVIVAVIVIIAIWMRRTGPEEELVAETRTIDPSGEPHGRGLWRGWRRRRVGPQTAVEAYVALIADLERVPSVRRRAGETPSAHASRMRSAGAAGLSLDLLAADYALARHADLVLSGAEDRRAVERWRVLRGTVSRWGRLHPPTDGRSPAAPDANVPLAEVQAEGRRTGMRPGG